MISAVVHEREQGSSWAEIGQYLGFGPSEAEERFSAHLDGWNTAFEVPYRLDTSGRKLGMLRKFRMDGYPSTVVDLDETRRSGFGGCPGTARHPA
ncbi:hypothetical protein [Streptomyces sp. NPDC001020]